MDPEMNPRAILVKKRLYMFNIMEEQININAPIFLAQQESNLQRPAEGTSAEGEKDDSLDGNHQDLNDTQNQLNINAPIFLAQQESNLQRPAEGTSTEGENDDSLDGNHQDLNDTQNHLAVYSPANAVSDGSDGTEFEPSQNEACRIAPSVKAFTAQCSICSKWRLLPTKEKFEEIRECIREQPFVCASVRQWRPEISCGDDPDLAQDGSRLWAIERPNIARPPLGWERFLRIRGSRGGRFADVYYVTPSGKRLRSAVEVQRYLLEHPDEAEGVPLSRFSFQIPKPLQENFVEEEHTDCVLALSRSSEAPQDRRKRRRMPSNRGRKD